MTNKEREDLPKSDKPMLNKDKIMEDLKDIPPLEDEERTFHSTCQTCNKLIPNNHFDCEREALKAQHAELVGVVEGEIDKEFKYWKDGVSDDDADHRKGAVIAITNIRIALTKLKQQEA